MSGYVSDEQVHDLIDAITHQSVAASDCAGFPMCWDQLQTVKNAIVNHDKIEQASNAETPRAFHIVGYIIARIVVLWGVAFVGGLMVWSLKWLAGLVF